MTRLPGILGLIADVTSQEAAIKLAIARGGTEIKVSGVPGGVLAQIVGDEFAAKIEAVLGGGRLVVPMANIRGQRGRRAQVAQLLGAGLTTTQAALSADVHERTAKRIRAALKQDDLPLFPK